jgi:hypothetical protein
LRFHGRNLAFLIIKKYFAYNKIKGESLKRLLLILSFILSITTLSLGQGNSAPVADVGPIVRFYPNPATTFVNFEIQKAQDQGYSIQIFNFLGRKMFEATSISQSTRLNLTDFNRGVYIYQLRDRSGRVVESGKFQVSK